MHFTFSIKKRNVYKCKIISFTELVAFIGKCISIIFVEKLNKSFSLINNVKSDKRFVRSFHLTKRTFLSIIFCGCWTYSVPPSILREQELKKTLRATRQLFCQCQCEEDAHNVCLPFNCVVGDEVIFTSIHWLSTYARTKLALGNKYNLMKWICMFGRSSASIRAQNIQKW